MAASEKDIQDVIKTLIAEGIGEGEEGMRRIAETIINRAEQRGISPAEVVRQRAQYTGYSNPGPAAVRAQSDPSALSAAQAAWQLAQGPEDPTGGANHYFNPSIVRPSWAQSMTPTGTFGGHAFYTDRPVPPRNIPPIAPVPASVEDRVTARNRYISPFGDDPGFPAMGEVVARIPSYAPTPASVEDRVTARNRVPIPSPFSDDPGTRANGPVIARIPSVSGFNGDPGTPASGPVVARIPSSRPSASDAARGRTPMNSLTVGGRPPIGLVEPGNLDLNSRQVYHGDGGDYRTENSMSIGTDRGEALIPTVVGGRQLTEQQAIDHYLSTGQNLGMFSSPNAADKYANTLHLRQEQKYAPTSRSPFNGDPGTPASGPVIATYPTTAPTTRTVPTTRVGNSSNNITQARNEQAIQRQVVPPTIRLAASPAPPIRTSADIASLYAQGGPTRPPAPVIPDRLTPSAAGLPANYGTMTPTQVAQIGLPSLAPPQIPLLRNQVATQLAVTPPVSVPLPRPRPYNQPGAQTPVRRPATPFGMPNAFPQQIAAPQPLRIVVQRNEQPVRSAPAPSTWAPAGYTNDGTGRITNNENGGVYYERHLR